ncbi:oxidoreductase [Planococcus shenhongbingii]|uniref:oxidoreductase n=1 Tax=Planococcus shenhongbingii TaxID=3058398 RepID=UPI0034630C95
MTIDSKTALLAGASGLVGTELLHILLESPKYEEVKIFVRKRMEIKHPKLEQVLVDYNRLENYEEYFNVNDIYCCLGTTIKKAGSQEAFRKVDYEYPLKMAELAKKHNAENFLIVSALGADPHSKVFYSRTKGEVEKQLKNLDLHALHIFQPSLLLGDRQEFRLGEKIASFLAPVFSPLLFGKLKKYKPVSARRVAYAMYQVGQTDYSGHFTYPSNRIYEISRSKTAQQKK